MARSSYVGAAAVAAALALAACSEESGLRAGLVTPSEIHAFYVSHPALFEGRRLYSLREIVVSAPAAYLAGFEARVGVARSLKEVETWLATQGIAYQTAAFTHPAEDVPLALLPRLASMRPGDLVAMSSPEGASVWQLVESREAPLSESEAAPAIEQFLAGRKRTHEARYEVRS
ncbi:MAG: peptidylprolyl isomerase [Pseudomonadota bacterium]|nr:peptidylprolyl isomerase [Pseudomonadota bacterium]